MARPTKAQKTAIRLRDRKIREMRKKGYPMPYLVEFFGISRFRIYQILKDSAVKK